MTPYLFQKEFTNQTFDDDWLKLKEFEKCIFKNCHFSQVNFIGVTFVDCVFQNCHFDQAKINHTAWRTVEFTECSMIDVNFAMSDKLIFEIRFFHCRLDFSKFYALKLRDTVFEKCSLISVDFMQTDLSKTLFDDCDLYQAEFEQAQLYQADFRSSRNYSINPEKTKLKGAYFSLPEAKGLLKKYDIVIVDL